MPVRDGDLLALGADHGVSIGSGRCLSRQLRRGLRKGAPELNAHGQVRGLPNVNPGFGGDGDGDEDRERGREQETKVTRTVARRFACGRPEPEGSVRGVASCRERLPGFSGWSMKALIRSLQSRFRSDSGRWECLTKKASRYPEMALVNSSSSA